jgi:capsular polysaccharide biosynthesis protein
VTMPSRAQKETPGPAWVFTALAGASTRPVEFALGLASVPYIGSALGHRFRVWCATGLIGIALGLGVYVKAPPPYQASTSVLLTQPSNVNPLEAVQTDVALTKSRAVAGTALRELRLSESISRFLTSYTVIAVTDRVVQFTVGAPTTAEAVQRATVLARAFLHFWSVEMLTGERLNSAVLSQQLLDARQLLTQAAGKVAYIESHPAAGNLKQAEHQANGRAIALRDVEVAFANNSVDTTTVVASSGILDPAAPLPRSHIRAPALYALAGMLAGLTAGIIYVMVGALWTDRLRRRDDVARALGAPVKLSVGPVPVPGWWPGRRGLAVTRSRDIQRIATHMRAALPNQPGGRAATLAVVAVDNPRLAAIPVLAVAIAHARAGFQVVLADLSAGAAAAQLLSVTGPGVRVVTAERQQFALVVPGPHDLTPEGPLRHVTDPARIRPDYATRPLVAAYQSADLLLALVTLDPGVGADYLTTWATDAAAIVTAGESSATRIHAAGEMMRQAHLPISSAYLLGADKNDMSVGRSQQRLAPHAARQPVPTAARQVGATSR